MTCRRTETSWRTYPLRLIPPVAIDYLHNGVNHNDLVSQLYTQGQAWPTLIVNFNRFRNLSTIEDSTTFSGFAELLNTVAYHDYREGIVQGTPHVLVDAEGIPESGANDSLAYLATENAKVVFKGNQKGMPVLDGGFPSDGGIPFDGFYPSDGADTFDDITNFIEQVPFTPENTPLMGLGPFGVHDAAHPQGHQGFDFQFSPGTAVDELAAANATLTVVLPGTHSADAPVFQLRKGYLLINTGGATNFYDTSLGMSCGTCEGPLNIPVHPDDVLGGVLSFFDFNETEVARIFHYGLLSKTTPICPYDAMSPDVQAKVLTMTANRMYYAQQLTEPFLCNSPERICPMKTLWTRTTNKNPANPKFMRLIRECDSEGHFIDQLLDTYEYEWLDNPSDTTPLRSGTIYLRLGFLGDQPKSAYLIDFNSEDWTTTYNGLYKIDINGPRSAELRLDVGSLDYMERPVEDLNDCSATGVDCYTAQVEQ